MHLNGQIVDQKRSKGYKHPRKKKLNLMFEMTQLELAPKVLPIRSTAEIRISEGVFPSKAFDPMFPKYNGKGKINLSSTIPTAVQTDVTLTLS